MTTQNRFSKSAVWVYSRQAEAAASKIPEGCVNERSHQIGMAGGDPLIVSLDAALKYAEAYQARFNDRLVSDYALGPLWLSWAKSLRGLLNGDGALAMIMGRTTDSKDNGACEAIFWAAMSAAGFTEVDL